MQLSYGRVGPVHNARGPTRQRRGLHGILRESSSGRGQAFESLRARKRRSLAVERGIAVIANYPLASGSAVRAVERRPLPDWAADIDCTSWSQLLLKFAVSHPAITCAIPGTGNPEHMADNVRAGIGRMPDEAMRKRIAVACAE
ncbi:MAG: hypothetical protein E6G97_03485 [Alphaproteobacteria bacterium]|nr:MAG: hypothetical protein E6G97_03485 [Alphaproteobacteria bacterium]